jgi:hypothetical protein
MSASNWVEPIPGPAETAAAPAIAEEAPRWSLATRIAFRFLFPFFLLVYLPTPLDFALPSLGESFSKSWNDVVQLIAANILGVTAAKVPTGSGDTMWDWVRVLIIVTLSAAIALVWSIVDRRAQSYPRLHAALRIYLRFALAGAMIAYGAMKVIPSQFPAPSLGRLMQTYGNSSPMGLLWTFMGASVAYNVFAGAGEMLGGLLLTMRRTTLAGALVSAAVLINIVVLNFSYDVPVKLYSSELLLTSLFLVAPDTKRLMAFFLQDHRPAGRKWLRVSLAVLRTAAVAVFVFVMFRQALELRRRYGTAAPKGPMYGIWTVGELKENGVVRPPLYTDATRWRRMVFTSKRASIQLVNEQWVRYNAADDQYGFVLRKNEDLTYQAPFYYTSRDPKTVLVHGTMDGKKIELTLHKEPEPTFLLNTRGFHWITEFPFTR